MCDKKGDQDDDGCHPTVPRKDSGGQFEGDNGLTEPNIATTCYFANIVSVRRERLKYHEIAR